MNKSRLIAAGAALSVVCSASAAAQQRPPIRQLGAVTAKTTEVFGNVASVRALSNGSLLVNDVPGRRVLMFDPQLSTFTVIADSTSATANAYGGRTGSLIAYRGDSTLFVDPQSVSMLVIDPAGKVARVVAIPRAEDASSIGGLGGAMYDGRGGIVYRPFNFGFRAGGGGAVRIQAAAPSGSATPGGIHLPEPPDSAFIVRVDLASRKLDTVGVVKIPKVKFETRTDDNGRFSMSSLLNPLPVVDEWVVTPDGAIAFVRGRDYHVDWVNPDGSKVASAKIPFNWQRLTDEDKVAFIDSVKAARERAGNSPLALGALGGGGAPQQNISIQIGPGGPGGGPGRGNPDRAPTAAQVNFIPANELPDYKPPFFAGSVKADTEGNIWVRTIPTEAVSGGPVYDVINRKGELVERVQIPVGRMIVGFGPGGAVYLANRDGTTLTLERASVR
ncbi:MAG TPA: hypothetical protein VF042_05730 [Gemmatimonadaceae bacterium]